MFGPFLSLKFQTLFVQDLTMKDIKDSKLNIPQLNYY